MHEPYKVDGPSEIIGNDLFLGRDRFKNDLEKKSVRAGAIRVVTNGTSTALTIISTIVLARLLTPKEFGLCAMVFAVTDFARLFIEMGLGTATVQKEEITHQEVSTLFWVNVGIGVASMVIVASLSPAIAWFYGESRLLHICMVVSVIFLIRGLTVQHRSLLERQMRFGYLGLIYVCSTLAGIVVAITMALKGFGIWALVWRELVASGMYAVGTWFFCGWMPGLPSRLSAVRPSLKFGADLLGVTFTQYFTQNLDRILIGRFFGATPLGLYTKAFQVAMLPVEHIQMTILGVGLSPLGALQGDPDRYRRYFRGILSILSFIYMPLVVFIAIRSELVIRLLLGEAWVSAAGLLRILAIAGFMRPILSICQLVMVSCGKTRRYLIWALMNGGFMIAAYAVGIRWEVEGVAYAYAIAGYAYLLWSLWFCFRGTPVSGLLVLKTISLPVISSWGAGIILLSLLPSIADGSKLLSIVSSGLIIALSYFGIMLCLPTGRQKLAEFWSYRAELFGKA